MWFMGAVVVDEKNIKEKYAIEVSCCVPSKHAWLNLFSTVAQACVQNTTCHVWVFQRVGEEVTLGSSCQVHRKSVLLG